MNTNKVSDARPRRKSVIAGMAVLLGCAAARSSCSDSDESVQNSQSLPEAPADGQIQRSGTNADIGRYNSARNHVSNTWATQYSDPNQRQ
ncbi:MAG: hypothetical protein RL701_4044 [Pseudomonadota bacterium]